MYFQNQQTEHVSRLDASTSAQNVASVKVKAAPVDPTTELEAEEIFEDLKDAQIPEEYKYFAHNSKSIEFYGSEVLSTFAYQYRTVSRSKIRHYEEISRLAEFLQFKIFTNETPVTKINSIEIDNTASNMSRALWDSYINKAIFVASGYQMFQKYFAELSEHYFWFDSANSRLSVALLKKDSPQG